MAPATRKRSLGIAVLSTLVVSSQASNSPPVAVIPPPPPPRRTTATSGPLQPDRPPPPPPPRRDEKKDDKSSSAHELDERNKEGKEVAESFSVETQKMFIEKEDKSSFASYDVKSKSSDTIDGEDSSITKPNDHTKMDSSPPKRQHQNEGNDNAADSTLGSEAPATTWSSRTTSTMNGASTQTHPLHSAAQNTRISPPPNRPSIGSQPLLQQRPKQVYQPPPPRQTLQQQTVKPRISPHQQPNAYYHVQQQQHRNTNNIQRPQPNQSYDPFQQQRRPPPQQPRPSQQTGPLQPQQMQKKPSTWRSLWRSIERGLDGLADVEDAVSGRAQQLYANTVRKAPPKPAAPPEEAMDWSRFQRSSTTTTTAPKKLGLPTFTHAPVKPKTAPVPKGKPRQQYRSVNWNDARAGQKLKPVANGGASPPPNDHRPLSADTIPQQPMTNAERIPAQFRQPATPEQQAPPRRKFPDEDDEEPSVLRRLAGSMPRLPRLSALFGQGSSGELASSAALAAWKTEDDASIQAARKKWSFPRFGLTRQPPLTVATTKRDGLAAPMQALAERIECQETTGLLRPEEETQCISIGRSKAFFDVLFLAFLMAGIHQLALVDEIVTIRGPCWEVIKTLFNRMDSIFVAAIDTWAPMALISAFLATRTSLLIGLRREKAFKAAVESSVQSQSQYGSLYLRLTSGAVLDRDAADKMIRATRSKIEARVGEARLRAFAICIVTPIVVAAFSFLRPILSELVTVLRHVFGSLQNSEMRPTIHEALINFARSSKAAFVSTFNAAWDQPLAFAYKFSFLVAVLLVAGLPQLMIRSITATAPAQSASDDHSELEYDDEMYYKFTEHIHSYGSSGINRLNLASSDAQLGLLDRWSSFSPSHRSSPLGASLRSTLRTGLVGVLSLLFLAAPLSFFFLGKGVHPGDASLFVPQWHSLLDVGCVVLLTQYLAWDAIVRSSLSSRFEGKVHGFITLLKKAITDKLKSMEKQPVPIGFRGTFSPSAGIQVRDLWASHVTKRAWALKGATLSCKNGEVLAIIGEDGSAKTRLLVALVESILAEDQGSRSLQMARGTISVGGMEVSKWDKGQLKSRVGVLLEDVNSLGATAQLFSGMSLEEILDPRPDAGIQNLHNGPGDKERNAMILALKMSGLYTTLMRRLPAKMDTIVTSSEEDLSPSPMRPRQHILSPSEWSKVLFAKVIARVLYDNDNPSKSKQSIPNSLVGSAVIMDDFTSHLSEAEEARILRDLRESGAATIFTSNRWAIGRLADRIAIMKDGAVVETGTHTELLTRGPKYSIYAAKWQAMAGTSTAG